MNATISSAACAAAVLAALLILAPTPAPAALGDCSQPVSNGSIPSATDCLVILQVAVNIRPCGADACVCAPKGTLPTSATDALICLKKATGQNVVLNCPCAGGTTTTSSTSTSFTTTSSTTSTTVPVGPVWPADPANYVAGPISYLNTLTIPPVFQAGATCCRDFGAISKNGVGPIDNALANLANLLLSLGVADFGAILNQSLQDGSLVVLLDHQLLDFASAVTSSDGAASDALRRSLPDDFALVQLAGAFAPGTTFTEASAGNGEFSILGKSFLPGTGEPENYVFPALMDTASMSAGPLTLELTLPFGFLTLDLKALDGEVSADHGTISTAGVPYTNGKLSGYVLVDDIYAGLNGLLLSSQCDCLGRSEPIYSKQPDGTWSGACLTNALDLCSQPDEEVCVTLAGNVNSNPPVGPVQACSILPQVINLQSDIDLNGDPSVYEALSLGLQFTGVTGQVTGVTP